MLQLGVLKVSTLSKGKKDRGQASQHGFWDASPDLARWRAGNDMREGSKKAGVKKDQQQERETLV